MSEPRTPTKPIPPVSATPAPNTIPSRFHEMRQDKTPAELKSTSWTRLTGTNAAPNVPAGLYDKKPNHPPNNPPAAGGTLTAKPAYVAPELQRHTYDPHQQAQLHHEKPYLQRATFALSLLTAALGLVLLLSSQVSLTGAVTGAPDASGSWGILLLLAGVGVLGARTWVHQ